MKVASFALLILCVVTIACTSDHPVNYYANARTPEGKAKIFHRETCSRLHGDRVVFSTVSEAKSAGYLECAECRPSQ